MKIDPYTLPDTPGDPDAGKPYRTIEGIAWRIGLSKDWIYRSWKTMIRMDGMPAPITRVSARGRKGRQPLRWDARSFEIWLASTQPPEIQANLGLLPGIPANENRPEGPVSQTLEGLMV